MVTTDVRSTLSVSLLRKKSFQDILAEIELRNFNFADPDLQEVRSDILRNRILAADAVEIPEAPNIVSALHLNPLRPANFQGLRDDQIAQRCLADIAGALLLRHFTKAETKIDFLRRLLAGVSDNDKYRQIQWTFHLYRAIHARLTKQFKDAFRYIDQAYKFCKPSPGTDTEAARIHIEQGDHEQALPILLRAERSLTQDDKDAHILGACQYLIARSDHRRSTQYLDLAVLSFARSPYLPAAVHLHALCDLAEARLEQGKLTPATRLLDEARALYINLPYLDQTGEHAIRASAYLAEADSYKEEDERESDYLKSARQEAHAAHRERLPSAEELAASPRVAGYLISSYIVHAESELNRDWARALRWLNNAAELAESCPDAKLDERINRARKIRMRHLPMIQLSPAEHGKGLNKAVAILKEKYIVAYLPVCRVVRHVAQLMGITEEEAHNTIRDIEKKASAADPAEHIQQWRSIYPQGYRRRS